MSRTLWNLVGSMRKITIIIEISMYRNAGWQIDANRSAKSMLQYSGQIARMQDTQSQKVFGWNMDVICSIKGKKWRGRLVALEWNPWGIAFMRLVASLVMCEW